MPYLSRLAMPPMQMKRFSIQYVCTMAWILFVVLHAVSISSHTAQASALQDAANITVHRTFTVSEHASETITLLELVDRKASGQRALALTWRTDSSSWFPAQYIALESDTGLLPNNEHTVTLRSVPPKEGHTYEVGLSFQPATGALGIAVYNTDENEYVLQYEARLNTTSAVLQAGSTDNTMQSNVYEPLGARWAVLTGPEHSTTVSKVLPAFDEVVWLRVNTVEPQQGRFHLLIQNDTLKTSVPLGTVEDGETVFPLAAHLFPLGLIQLHLQYVIDDEVVWQSRPQTLQTGLINAAPQTAYIAEDAEALHINLELEATAPLDENTDLSLAATVYAMAWNTNTARYDETVFDYHVLDVPVRAPLTKETQTSSLRVPLPAEAGLWRIELTLQSEPEVAINFTQNNIRLSTISNAILGTKEVSEAMRICSYNMLGFEGYPMQPTISYLGDMDDLRRVNHFANVIRQLNCDIIGVQEAHSVEMMKRLAQKLNTNLVAFPSASRFPGGIFTDYSVKETRLFNHAGPSYSNEPFSRFGGAALLHLNGNDTWVINFHAWPHEEEMREQEASILQNQLERLMETTPHVIVMGDFNSEVGGPFDRVLTELRFVNVMGLNWIGIQPTIPNGDKAIDHVYVSTDLVPHITSGHIHKGQGFDSPNPLGSGEWYHSDHYPVIVELTWP